MSYRINIIISSLIVLLLIFICSCSTEKDALLNKAYHNTTAKYNGYFNANEIIKEAMLQYRQGRKENYYALLPIYIYANDEESKNLYSPMDTAAAKCEIAIGRHSMPGKKRGKNRNAEWCKWIDDNWMTIGWSQFYKRDFEKAFEKFEYIEKQYKYVPIFYEAIFWQAKTLIEIEDFRSAEEILLELLKTKKEFDELESEKEKFSFSSILAKIHIKNNRDSDAKLPPVFPKDLANRIYPTLADLYLREKEYHKAIQMLEISIGLKQKREFKTRMIFILAQIHHHFKDNKASDLYEEVVKRNPDYEMAFQAKINRALAFGGSDSKSIKHQLLKMLKDDKNIDYFDQIYYALAEIEIKEGQQLKGIEYLEFSVDASISNKYQKTTSLIRLADLYYLEKNYRKAHQYFEQTMSVIPVDHENYKLIESKNKNLGVLIEKLDVIHLNDSIISLCHLPEKEVINLIKKIIDKKKEELEKEKEEREMKLSLENSLSEGGKREAGGKLFLWDNNLRGMGFNDFKKTWGSIQLEDNWRRSNKNTSSIEMESSSEKDSITSLELTINYYLDQLPCGNNEKLSEMEDALMNALYTSGSIYLHNLNDPFEASKMYTRVSSEFLPKDKAIAGLYQLYLLYKEQGNIKKSDVYKNNILNNYKNSEYAKLIINPNYMEGERLKKQKQAIEYAAIYDLYQVEKFTAVIEKTNSILINDTTNTFFCKYSYLNALSLGKSSENNDSILLFTNALSRTVTKCSETDYYAPAKLLLDKIRNVQSVENAKNGISTFIYNAEQPHLFALFVPKGEGNINSVKTKLSNFNKASFSNSGLKTSSSFLNSKDQIVTVQLLTDVASAMDYFVAFKVNDAQVKDINKGFSFFVISEKNLASLYLEKNLDDYLQFFLENYIN